jgi:hypothetical protein
MGTTEAQDTTAARGHGRVSQRAGAQSRLIRLPVRGLSKVRCVALLYALAHNPMHGAGAQLGLA